MGAVPSVTPYMDRLAAEGALFTRHFTNVPTCGASRYALLTGRAPRVSGVRAGNDTFHRGPARLTPGPHDGAQSMPELFRRNGYHTVLLGKLSHMPDGRVYAYDGSGDGAEELPGAFHELATPFGSWARGWGAFFAYPNGLHREKGLASAPLMDFDAVHDDELPDGLIASAACQQLASLAARSEPFFLAVGFFKPHMPFVAPHGDWVAVERELATVSLPVETASRYAGASAEFNSYVAPFVDEARDSPANLLATRRAYFACVRYVDRQVGRVLEALDVLGLEEDTIVVLWGDHGWHLGESGIFGKHTPFERALHAPLVVRAPGRISAGVRIDALVESVDVYPTLVDLCDLGERATRWPLDGASLLPLFSGERSSVREAAIATWGAAVSVRTERWRMITRERGGTFDQIELYDLREGPEPTFDHAASEPEIVARLLRLLETTRSDSTR